MTRKRTRRKHYDLVNPITLAIRGACVPEQAVLDQLRLTELSAIRSFETACATPDDWRAMADMANVATTMADMGIGRQEVVPVALAVEEALSDAHARYLATGRVELQGVGLEALRELYDYHDLQRTSVDRRTYERAILATANRIRSAHPSLKVCCGDPKNIEEEEPC